MPEFAKIQFALALGSIGLQNVQKVFNYVYFKHAKPLGHKRIVGAVDRMVNAEHGDGEEDGGDEQQMAAAAQKPSSTSTAPAGFPGPFEVVRRCWAQRGLVSDGSS